MAARHRAYGQVPGHLSLHGKQRRAHLFPHELSHLLNVIWQKVLRLKSFQCLSLFFLFPKRHILVVWSVAFFITWGFFLFFLSFFLGKLLVNKTVILSSLHLNYVAKKSLNLKMSRPFRCTPTLGIEIIHAKLIIVSRLHDRIRCLCKEVNWNTPRQISLIFHQISSSKSTVFSQIVYEIIYATFLAINVWSSPSQKKTTQSCQWQLQQSDFGNAFIFSRWGFKK